MRADRNSAMRGAGLALSGLFTLAALGAGGLWISQGVVASPVASPDVLAAESVRALRAGDAAAAEHALSRELAWGERRASAWCRLAYAHYLRARRVDAATAQALAKSYEVAPLDVDAFAWRLQFVFQNWEQVDPSLRRLAIAEARAFHSQWPTRPIVENVIGQVSNPTGKFAMRLAVRGAEPKELRFRGA